MYLFLGHLSGVVHSPSSRWQYIFTVLQIQSEMHLDMMSKMNTVCYGVEV